MNFKKKIHFCGSFLPFWIRIRIHWPDWIRIQSGSGYGSESSTLPLSTFLAALWIYSGSIRYIFTFFGLLFFTVMYNVPNPDPDPPDPHVFGPQGSGSTSQMYGSGSGSFYLTEKIVIKTLINTVLWLLFDFLSLKNDVKVPSKSTMQKNFWKKIVFCWYLEGQWRK